MHLPNHAILSKFSRYTFPASLINSLKSSTITKKNQAAFINMPPSAPKIYKPIPHFKLFMKYKKGMELDEVIGRYDSLSAQIFLNDMPYDFETADSIEKYHISSPKITLEKGSAMCIDGALLAAALTGKSPNILVLSFPHASHSVLIIPNHQTKKFGAIGKSRDLDFTIRDCIYENIDELAKSYKSSLSYASFHWNLQFPDWLTTDKDMNSVEWPKEKRTKKFSIHYYTNSHFMFETHR